MLGAGAPTLAVGTERSLSRSFLQGHRISGAAGAHRRAALNGVVAVDLRLPPPRDVCLSGPP
jgi:hypothetical protein